VITVEDVESSIASYWSKAKNQGKETYKLRSEISNRKRSISSKEIVHACNVKSRILSVLLSTRMSLRFRVAFCYLFRRTLLRIFDLLLWMLTT